MYLILVTLLNHPLLNFHELRSLLYHQLDLAPLSFLRSALGPMFGLGVRVKVNLLCELVGRYVLLSSHGFCFHSFDS